MSLKSEFGKQLEAYFSGEMKGADRLVFEGRVESDPMLKAEFESQQDIVKSLREHRVAELKTRLSSINVEPTLIGALLHNTLLKPVLYGVSSMIVVASSYIFFNTGDSIDYQLESLEGKREFLTFSNIEINNNQKLDYRYTERAIKFPIIQEKVVVDVTAEKIKTHSEISFEVPEVEGGASSEDFKAPTLALNEVQKIEELPVSAKIDKVSVNTVVNRKYNFHYRVEDNRLYLYGKFNQSPYEIIELNSPAQRSMFFFYDGHFYNLNKDAKAVTPLSRIEDAALTKKLQEIKSGTAQ